MVPEPIADYACVCGENPVWHPDEQRLYWTDIPTGRMFRYDPATGHHEQFYSGPSVGGITIQRDGALLLFMERGAVREWNAGNERMVIDSLPDELDSRFNDVIADPEGRVFCGTMPGRDRPGRLYRLDPDGSIHRLLDGIQCSNGLGFSRDLKTLYYTDSRRHAIYAFDYDRATGEISNQRVHIQSAEADGIPDGMTVDREGCIWSAHWDGSCLLRYRPDGMGVERVGFPARKVSSCAFGGPDLSTLYVTTAGGDAKATEGDGAGALFRLRPDVGGVEEFRSCIRVG